MTDLLGAVRAYADRHDLLPVEATVVVGVSGGADSLCLLHLLNRVASERSLRLHVAHLDHGLRGAGSAADAQFVGEVASAWDLPFHQDRLAPGALNSPGSSVEEAARNARYAFLARVAHAVGAAIIAVGHNADDQAETVLMHFLRGSGLAGLRGMLPRSELGGYRLGNIGVEQGIALVRPLLDATRVEIEEYCAAQVLAPRQDATNADISLYRNRLRHELMPLLESYNPGIRSVLRHTAEVAAGDHQVLRAATEQAWERVVMNAPQGEVHLDLAGWCALPVGLQRAVVREAIARLRRHLRNINWIHVERAVRLAQMGQTGQSATLAAGLALYVRYDKLIIGPETLSARSDGPYVNGPVPLTLPGKTPLAGGWSVETSLLSVAALDVDFEHNQDPWCAYLDARAVGPSLLLRPRVPGDVFRPHGLEGHTARVNEFMINARVPREERRGWPLLVAPWGIAWLCGLRLDERAIVRPETTHVCHIRFVKE